MELLGRVVCSQRLLSAICGDRPQDLNAIGARRKMMGFNGSGAAILIRARSLFESIRCSVASSFPFSSILGKKTTHKGILQGELSTACYDFPWSNNFGPASESESR